MISEVKFTAGLWPVLHDLILGLERDSWNERDTEDGDDGDHDHNSATDTLKHIITIHHIYLLHTFKFTTPGMCLKCVRNDYHPMITDQSYARSLSLNYPLYLVCLYVPHTYVQGQKRDCRTTEKNRVTDLFRQTNINSTYNTKPNVEVSAIKTVCLTFQLLLLSFLD